MMETYDGKFYLGKTYDLEKGEITADKLLYDPDDLTTHAVAFGMTGSGKTGLCIDLLEEAALNEIPALMIDPKGDMTNTLLHFPDLLPEDFLPWVNPDEARREGKTLEQSAADAASLWSKGLEGWGIGEERLQALKDSVQYTIYTPGSESGMPVNILSSLEAPGLDWEKHREILREKISGVVMGLLGLVGLDEMDPVRSPEHILLSNIFEHAWSQGQDLDLGELILQIQNPPFEKLGMMDVEAFLPEKERVELSMMLNNILAAPSFQSWIIGQPLDIGELLMTPEGRPRHSVFYIAHLSDAERMFFVTLLYSAVETWMRSQKGSTSLRALLYFDEIYGYLPPVANPPSKTPMLRMLKQARAFGVGQVLVTQNPVDVDYKALSNAGTWFIGKLQTEQDKERLLDGLEGASPGMERKAYDRLISRLDKRIFLLHNVHEEDPVLFHTRWAMNYLTGPLTRNQIPALNKLAGLKAGVRKGTPAEEGGKERTKGEQGETEGQPQRTKDVPGSSTPPSVPRGVDEYFYPLELDLDAAVEEASLHSKSVLQSVILYRPVLASQANVRFLKRNYNLDYEEKRTALVLDPEPTGRVDWESWLEEPLKIRALRRKPETGSRFADLRAPLSDEKTLNSLQADFKDWIYHTFTVMVKGYEDLDVYAGPRESKEDFRKRAAEAAGREKETEIEKINESYKKKIDRMEERILKEERELEEDEMELSQRKMEEMGTHVENVLSLLAGRKRRLSTSLSKRRMTSKAKSDVKESLAVIEEYEEKIEELEEERKADIQDVEETWDQLLEEVEEIPIAPFKKDILIELFGVIWYPYYLIEGPRGWVEVPAFS